MKKFLLLACIAFVTFFVNNQVIAPDIMESRNIVTAREMVYDGNWIVTTMNGALRLEKPPLPTWLTAVTEYVAPDNICLQRGMAGLAAVLLTLYFFLFAERILKLNPWTPTLLLLTSYNVILIGRTASWDIYCHAFMMGCIFHSATALLKKGRQWAHLLAAGLYMGLSMMSKGPVSHYGLLLPFILSFALFCRPLQTKGKGKVILAAVILGLVVGAWWYGYIYAIKANEMTAIAAQESGSWINRNVRPWYYYWKFFLETGVWSLLMLTSIVLPWFNRQRRQSKTFLFSLGWMLISLVLLSLLPEKKNRYLLPLLIPASYVMACLLEWWKEKAKLEKADVVLFRINSGLITAVVALLPIAAWLFLGKNQYIGWMSVVIIALVCLGIAWLLFKATKEVNAKAMLYSVTALFLIAECFVLPLCDSIINNPDKQSIAQTREMHELDALQFYYDESQPLRIELVYAANRKILPIDINNVETLSAHLPLLLLTHEPLPKEMADRFSTEYVGLFDDNNRPKNNRRYSGEFLYHATILRQKTK